MLTHPTLDKLQALRLTGMARALEEQLQMTGIEELGFCERLGLLVDREMTERENRRLHDRLAKARLRQTAVVEDIDFRAPRGLDRSLFSTLLGVKFMSTWEYKAHGYPYYDYMIRDAPQTSARNYRRAQEGLQKQEELTFASDEIDRLLPEALRRPTPPQ